MKDVPSWLHILKIPMPATLGTVSCYLIQGPDGVALLDTGVDNATAIEALSAKLALRGLTIADVEQVVCTHHHVDHSGLGRMFQNNGATVLMSRPDADILVGFFANPDQDMKTASFLRKHGLDKEASMHAEKALAFFRSLHRPFSPQVIPDDSREIVIGGIDFRVLRLPGHTPGHIGLLQKDAKIVFSGDSVLTREAVHISPPWNDDEEDHFDSYIRSLECLQSSGATRGFPGHGAVIEDLRSSVVEVRLHLLSRLEAVLKALEARPLKACQLAHASGGEQRRPVARWMQTSMTLACLNHLVNRGSAARVDTAKGPAYRRA